MQQTVRLLGDLGERYGSEHKYHDLRSPADAIKLLCINEPEFVKEMAQAHEHGIGYTVVQADEFLDYGDLHLPLGKNDLIVTPVVAGSGGGGGGGIGKILIGAALVAVAIANPAVGLFGGGALGFGVVAGATVTLGATLAAAAGTVGIGLLLTGTAQLLAPQPTVPSIGTEGRDRTSPGENTNAAGPQGVSRATSGQQSYAFSGPANTVGVGATVPLVYGKVLIGSHLLSSKVEVTSESDPTGAFFIAPGNKTITINGETPSFKFELLNGLRTRRWFYHHTKFADKQSSNGRFIRRKRSDTLNFIVGEIDKVDPVIDFDSDDVKSENLQIFFEIDNGLSRVVGSQLVPAFVTYEITLKKSNYDGESPVFGKVRATIQGLLRKTDSYKWCHAIDVGHSGVEDNDTIVDTRVQVIDTDADNKGGRIRIRAIGYQNFRDKSENFTENLVTDA
jgi:predicted phage tail protein